jgi:hypothetical protein
VYSAYFAVEILRVVGGEAFNVAMKKMKKGKMKKGSGVFFVAGKDASNDRL